jgi:hypothetical protein
VGCDGGEEGKNGDEGKDQVGKHNGLGKEEIDAIAIGWAPLIESERGQSGAANTPTNN